MVLAVRVELPRREHRWRSLAVVLSVASALQQPSVSPKEVEIVTALTLHSAAAHVAPWQGVPHCFHPALSRLPRGSVSALHLRALDGVSPKAVAAEEIEGPSSNSVKLATVPGTWADTGILQLLAHKLVLAC